MRRCSSVWGFWRVIISECYLVFEYGDCLGQGQGLSWVYVIWEGFLEEKVFEGFE